jgi:hypothetical protein
MSFYLLFHLGVKQNLSLGKEYVLKASEQNFKKNIST